MTPPRKHAGPRHCAVSAPLLVAVPAGGVMGLMNVVLA